MKKVFQAYDGTLFDSAQDSLIYEAASNQPYVVIIDDDPDIIETVSEKLHNAKIKHKVFQDPLEAMNFITHNKIAVVYTDYHMHGFGLSGKWIKEICNQKNIECSIISADDEIADISKIEFVRNCLALVMLSLSNV
jgi:DNA-binding NtrC family response regulator